MIYRYWLWWVAACTLLSQCKGRVEFEIEQGKTGHFTLVGDARNNNFDFKPYGKIGETNTFVKVEMCGRCIQIHFDGGRRHARRREGGRHDERYDGRNDQRYDGRYDERYDDRYDDRHRRRCEEYSFNANDRPILSLFRDESKGTLRAIERGSYVFRIERHCNGLAFTASNMNAIVAIDCDNSDLVIIKRGSVEFEEETLRMNPGSLPMECRANDDVTPEGLKLHYNNGRKTLEFGSELLKMCGNRGAHEWKHFHLNLYESYTSTIYGTFTDGTKLETINETTVDDMNLKLEFGKQGLKWKVEYCEGGHSPWVWLIIGFVMLVVGLHVSVVWYCCNLVRRTDEDYELAMAERAVTLRNPPPTVETITKEFELFESKYTNKAVDLSAELQSPHV